jgi:tRNA1Val (adenine37-N6)-methyltransferase
LDAGRLLGKASELLSPEGRFSLILPADQIGELVRMAEEKGLYPSRLTWVITHPGLSPKRALVEFRKESQGCMEDELLIELERHVYSEGYIALTKDFYLKM